MSSILPTADAFCQAAVPSYMADLSFAATADDGAQVHTISLPRPLTDH
jgi:hypothetical protein